MEAEEIMNIDEIEKELKRLKSLIFKSTHIKTCTMISDEIKKSLKGLGGFSNEHAESIVENMDEIKKLQEHWTRQQEQLDSLEKIIKGGWRDCKECDLYGECDHQGAYKKDGKWCYEDFGGEKPEQIDLEEFFGNKEFLAKFDITNFETEGKKYKIGTRKKRPDLLDEVLGTKGYAGEPEEDVPIIVDEYFPKYKTKKFTPFETEYKLEPKRCNDKDFLYAKHNFDLPEDYKPIKEITTKRKDYMDAKVPSNFELHIDDIIEGKAVAEPDTIDFNGTLYCKIEDMIEDLHNLGWYGCYYKYKALLNG